MANFESGSRSRGIGAVPKNLTVQLARFEARERERLDKEIAKLESELQTAEEKLKNKSFVQRAPTAVVEEHRNRLKHLGAQLATLKQARDRFS